MMIMMMMIFSMCVCVCVCVCGGKSQKKNHSNNLQMFDVDSIDNQKLHPTQRFDQLSAILTGDRETIREREREQRF